MMGRILNNHQDVHTFPELHFFEQMWSGKDKDKILSSENAQQLAARLLNISAAGYFAKKEPERYEEQAATIVQKIPVTNQTSLNVFGAVIEAEAKRHGKRLHSAAAESGVHPQRQSSGQGDGVHRRGH